MTGPSRRQFALGVAAVLAAACSGRAAEPEARGPRRLILAPSSLGLRPGREGHVPGAWRAPAALMAAGLQAEVGAEDVVSLDRPEYEFGAQPGTRIRNGHTIRRFSLALGDAVRDSIHGGRFPIVVGGDCSVLLGALAGLRNAGGRGLVHIDGHSDFFHPGNYDSESRLGAVAGMDLALATGRGEALLATWPGIDGPLVRDEDAIQIGERGALVPAQADFHREMAGTGITRLIVQDVLAEGIPRTVGRALELLAARQIDRAWVHVDLDVLDRVVMPAVDSPGSPGLDFAQLSGLIGGLVASGRIAGATVAIYDPELDPGTRYASPIARALGEAFARLP